ncbi:hypothetical protein HMPREF9318_00809 [Streptococcus urinalis FB127-CNA-2]|nr:hypothetical protein HMPREF9318_00809 [Streptococcus urinalis FB127-CNA-2]VEF32380.1 Transcriptional regulatory protein ZraR [Streptococcus urinalis]
MIFTYSVLDKTTESQNLSNIINNLKICDIYSPSLNERKNEFSSIITILINRLNLELNTSIIGFDPKAFSLMNNFKWFQNFNQLEKDVKKLIIESPGYYISEYLVTKILNEEIIKYQLHINSEASENTIKNYNSKKTLFDYNQDIIKTVLAENDGNQTKTAKQLGISRTTLWRYLNT